MPRLEVWGFWRCIRARNYRRRVGQPREGLFGLVAFPIFLYAHSVSYSRFRYPCYRLTKCIVRVDVEDYSEPDELD